MFKITQELIRLGHNYPKLRGHLRPVLAEIQKTSSTLYEKGRKIRVFEEGRRVYFEFPYNARIKDGIKNRGANWDSKNRMWWVGKTKKNFDQILNYFKQEVEAAYGTPKNLPRTVFEAMDGEIQVIEKFDRFDYKFPYHEELKNKLKRLRARWDGRSKVWYMAKGSPNLDDALDLIKDYAQEIVEETEAKNTFKAEVHRRKSKGLAISIDFEHKDLAKKEGGIWDKMTKTWLMPDEESKGKVLLEIRDRKQEERLRKEQDKKREVMDRLNRDVDPSEIKTMRFSGTSRGDKPSVGQLVRTRDRGLVEVISVNKGDRITDGRSFGHDFDDGWAWTAYTVPAKQEDIEKIENEDRQRQNKREALAVVGSIEASIKRDGVKPEGNTLVEGDRLAVRGRDLIIRGGGSWFHIEGERFIWFVRNNGADGDTWARNNIETGGAGAIGWRIPYDPDIAASILDAHQTLKD